MQNDGIRVLVVEDNPDWSQALVSMLQQADSFQVVGTASNGIDAVEQAASKKPDLILLDIGLPRLNGLGAARRIRDVHSAAKIIFVTENSDPDFVRAALDIGGRGYIFKSRASSELLTGIAIVLNEGILVSNNLSDSLCEASL